MSSQGGETVLSVLDLAAFEAGNGELDRTRVAKSLVQIALTAATDVVLGSTGIKYTISEQPVRLEGYNPNIIFSGSLISPAVDRGTAIGIANRARVIVASVVDSQIELARASGDEATLAHLVNNRGSWIDAIWYYGPDRIVADDSE